jgi:hypothetical protein
MSEKKTNGSGMFAPFNIISMKDIKDKTTKKQGLRPLFGCIESIQESVEDIREFLSTGPDGDEVELCNGFLKQLTDMQVKLIEVTKSKVTGQNLAPIDQVNKAPAAKLEAAPAAPAAAPVETPQV